jgi:hypothetical protein
VTLELDALDRELALGCRACRAFLMVWVDWDGSTAFWFNVRDVHVAPVGDGASFRQWCLDRLVQEPYVIMKEWNGVQLFDFCANDVDVQSVRQMLAQGEDCYYSWLRLGPSGGLSLSHEFGGSGRALHFMTTALEWGPMRIMLPL